MAIRGPRRQTIPYLVDRFVIRGSDQFGDQVMERMNKKRRTPIVGRKQFRYVTSISIKNHGPRHSSD